MSTLSHQKFYTNPSPASKVEIQNTTTCAADRGSSEFSYSWVQQKLVCKILPHFKLQIISNNCNDNDNNIILLI